MSLFLYKSGDDLLTTSTDDFRGNSSNIRTIADTRVRPPNYTKEQIAERLLQANDKRRLTMIRKNLKVMEDE